VNEYEVFERIGEDGFARLVEGFYAAIPTDPILGPMYPADDLQGPAERLRDFLVGRFGGPARYVEQRGHPRLRMRHMQFSITPAARDRWIVLMGRSLEAAKLGDDVTKLLADFFVDVAAFLQNRP
jgi:hemoglobin